MSKAPSVKCDPVELTDEQRANLAKLAAYLRTLPADYPDFEMSEYVQGGGRIARVACGSAACAVGHGPSAGIEPVGSEDWDQYSARVFISGIYGCAWGWCFAGGWSRVDNTVHGAAARIELLLEQGVPTNYYAQRTGHAPLCYTVEGDA